ncbi:MAG: S9 family peptidase [Bacteroidetes bacterium]|nr:MAG: S9 family peptidase [Bacteroidota bacterium]REK00604.1 MAG: S9 family peptidase [Bacteroidota bacterium]REK35274.1 MAG: S9 family peptidase [Bacteroidota bacterium]REK48350.1 MAG: S9 family peptidase [Bacteroidota bacterium]
MNIKVKEKINLKFPIYINRHIKLLIKIFTTNKIHHNMSIQKILSACIIAFLMQSPTVSSQKAEIGNLLTQNIPKIPESLTEQMNRYNDIRTATFTGWLKKEKGMLVVTRFGETNQIHLVKEPMGMRKQLTFEKEPVNWASVCPDTSVNGFIYGKDVGGNENFQFHYFNLDNSSSRLLTDGKSKHGSLQWSHSGKRFAYTSNRRNPADMDLYIASLANPSDAKLILERKGGGWGISDWSKDEKYMILQEYISVNQSNLHLLNLESGELSQINLTDDIIAFTVAFFNSDGTGIFIGSDQGREFSYLSFYDLKKKQYTWSLPEMGWDVQGVNYNRERTKIIFRLNKNGFSELFTLDPKTFTHSNMKGFPEGIVGSFSFSRDGQSLGFNYQNSAQSQDAYSYDLKSGKITRWTESEMGSLDRNSFVSCSAIEYPSFDKVNGQTRKIPAFLYKPKTEPGEKLPVLISIHGGPESQSVPNFSSNTQFMVKDLGIAVLVPNIRGSTGYGKTYTTLDNGFLRLDAVKDIEYLIQWIGTQPDLDASRIAVMGGSYGGTMVLMCMTELGDKIRCGVDLFGSSNIVTFLKNTSSYRQDLRRVEYGDERDPAMEKFLQEIAPLNKLDKFTKPIFIYQGKNDPRVPLSESEQIVDALSKNGKTVWYVMAKDEGHGLGKKPNREFTYAAIALFLQEHLIK